MQWLPIVVQHRWEQPTIHLSFTVHVHCPRSLNFRGHLEPFDHHSPMAWTLQSCAMKTNFKIHFGVDVAQMRNGHTNLELKTKGGTLDHFWLEWILNDAVQIHFYSAFWVSAHWFLGSLCPKILNFEVSIFVPRPWGHQETAIWIGQFITSGLVFF